MSSATQQDRATAVVIGGGLAGITAALRLAEAGLAVTLVEGRPRLGGLAFSFQRGDLTVDNGQHVFLRCCTAYRGLIDRLGAGGMVSVQRRLDVPVLDVSGADPGRMEGLRLGRLRRTALPVPLHLAGSLARYPHLGTAERLQVVRATLALYGLDPADPALDERSFGDWLRQQGQSRRTVEALWDLVGVATLNATADQVSLALAAMVFKTGLLSAPGASDIGWADVPLGVIHHDAALDALHRSGVRVLLRARAAALKSSAGGPEADAPGAGNVSSQGSNTHRPTAQGHDRHAVRVEGERLPAGGELLHADAVVLAVPQDAAAQLLPPDSLDGQDRLRRLGTAPILNVHAIYDRRVLRRPFFAGIGTPVQWVFDRTRHSGLAERDPHAQYLAVSQSAAQDEIDLPVAELRRRYLPELERLLPAARGARLRDFFVTRERTATFDPAPGSARLRPGARTRVPGLLLAGAWTATGWPATMEGAVRSGHTAADEALATLGARSADLAAAYAAGRWPR
ncbi:hydroxysqualene dehydroxylase HpnE [Peterkaempfera bronchialis]|uniref:FAD-dependent oxidoreductase n=1 Tax=Peterkaempfera bronchialis TaxID=2126346 RepID=A0A345SSR4_9ACTN|nr:hydroxysqualene dehydroxylase HpnE [Peterkaempfera bronchialis]AXI76769.1 FAD-dependent oxidoreductase [Peterkaempfera bronchialis]